MANTASVYQSCSRDDPADCRLCGRPLAGDNDRGVCYQCQREIAWSSIEEQDAKKAWWQA